MELVYTGNMVEIFKLSQRLYFRRANLPLRQQGNSVFIVGESGVAIVDPSTVEAAEEMLAEIALLFGKPLRYVFLTHNHPDHAEGLPVFFKLPVTVFCSHKCAEEIGRINDGAAAIAGVRGSLSFLLDGYRVELVALDDAAHSPWDMLVRLPEERAVCTGDLVVEFESLFFHYANPERWVANLRELALGRDEYVLPGHGGVYPATMITDVADFLETLIFAARECIDRFMPVLGPFTARDPDYATLDRYVAEYLAEDTPTTRELREKARGDAQRELRMMVRCLFYRELV
ncbi:MAG: MBL fold metallo-hydrolase [Oscillospiraceae bacterium]|nr:MBL fold metallo-hydrolase [Oscillospiraceae bacterium]